MTLLPLISPTGSNFMKDFPSQHAVNMNLMDAYVNSSLTSHPLKSYIPLFTATTTNPTLGTGSQILRAVYYEIFDQIYTWGEFRFGTSGFNAGSGTWGMSLPFPAKSTIGNNSNSGLMQAIGVGSVWVNAVFNNIQPVTVHLRDSTTVQFTTRIGLSAREVSNSHPVTWAVQDGITWFAHYQRA